MSAVIRNGNRVETKLGYLSPAPEAMAVPGIRILNTCSSLDTPGGSYTKIRVDHFVPVGGT